VQFLVLAARVWRFCHAKIMPNACRSLLAHMFIEITAFRRRTENGLLGWAGEARVLSVGGKLGRAGHWGTWRAPEEAAGNEGYTPHTID
jgi:hypothetical protein